MRVSVQELIDRFDDVADRAEAEPVTITREGRDRLVLVSAEQYRRLSVPGLDADGPSGRPRKDLLALHGSMRGTVTWDADEDITAPTGEVWKAEL